MKPVPPSLGLARAPPPCPHSGGRIDLPRGPAVPVAGHTVLCSRAMCCGGAVPGELAGLGGITSRFPARSACH